MSKRLRPSTQPSSKGLSIRPKAGQGRNSSLSLIPPAPRLSQPGPAPAAPEQEAAARDSSTFETQRLPSVIPAAAPVELVAPVDSVDQGEDEPESREEYTAPSAVLPAAALDWDDAKGKAVEVIAAQVPEPAPAFIAEALPIKNETAIEASAEVPSSKAEPPSTRAESPAAKAEAAVAPVEVKAAPVEAVKVAEVAKAAEPVDLLESTSPSLPSPLAATAKVAPSPAGKSAEAAFPAPAAAAKVERPAVDSGGKSGKKNKGGKGQPARVEPVASAAKPAAKVEGEGDDEAKPSRRSPGSGRTGVDEMDLSSVSAEFFRRDHDSVPPVTEAHIELDEPLTVPLTPAALARRAQLRRVVAGVVSFAAVLSIAVVGKTLAAGKRPSSTLSNKPPVVQEAKPSPKPDKPEESAAAVVTAAPEPVAPASATPSAVPSAIPSAEPAAVPSADPSAPASATPSAVPSAEPAAEPSADAAALRRETENLLNRGKTKDAIAKAREAIAADPTHASPYLFLGSALQDTGHWKDGIEAYSECVRNATKGPVNECRQMGGHK